ncbi:hypothetical protein [Neorhizobium sp. T25_13]|uniref:hypothetical protein n=1 Tax=Neorhizobium sp. T25_13 TaxID=2093830 RepID=UPI000CF88011|nr:hypothetical protein [Neorhizobium sp. T25_13]
MQAFGGGGRSSFRPSKILWLWSLVGASVLTMIVGFTWGGWTTSASVREMNMVAARDARADLVADICVHDFISASDAGKNLQALKATSSWERENFIKEGGWTKVAGIEGPVINAANNCAEQLMEMKELPQQASSAVTDS